MLAAKQGNNFALDALLMAGTAIKALTSSLVTATMRAARAGQMKSITFLAEQDAALDRLSNTQYNKAAIHFSALGGHTSRILALVEGGGDIDLLESAHSTALIYASYYGGPETTQALLEAGADFTVKDDGGSTALDRAEKKGLSSNCPAASRCGSTIRLSLPETRSSPSPAAVRTHR